MGTDDGAGGGDGNTFNREWTPMDANGAEVEWDLPDSQDWLRRGGGRG